MRRAERAAQRAQHVQVGRRAVAGEAGALALPFGRLGELGADQVRQLQVVEEDLHELFARQREDEVVLAFARRCAWPRRCRRPPPPLRPLDAVAGHVFLVARVHDLAVAALAVAERRLGDVLLGNA